jgi:hypothetical protein
MTGFNQALLPMGMDVMRKRMLQAVSQQRWEVVM